MNKRTRLVLLLLLSFTLNKTALSQSFSIAVHLTSEALGTPVAGATIVLNPGNRQATSDALGNFKFNGLKQDEYTIIVSFLGYEKATEKIKLTTNVALKIALKDIAVDLTEVTVSPTKAITCNESVSGIDKLLRPINNAQDLLTLVPGLFIAQHAGGGKAEQIFLRGFDNDHGTDFNITVDGMPVNMVSHAHGQGYADFHFVIPETVDKLNVYKGPYTTRFGDFATTGTGEFLTKNALAKNEVKLEAGRYDSYRALGIFNLLDKKHLFTKGKESAYLAGEYVFTNAYFNVKQKLNRYNFFGKYTGMLNANNFLTFSGSTFFSNWDASGQVPQRAVDAGLISRFGSIDATEGGQTNRTNINAILNTSTANGAVIKNQVYYVNYHFNLYSNFTFFLNDPIHGDQINQTDSRNIFGYTGTYQKDSYINDKVLHTTFGMGTRNDFADISLKHSEKRIVLDTLVAGKLTQQNTFAYVDFTFDFNKHFSINTGCRLDYFRFQFQNIAHAQSGTESIVRPSPKLNFYYAVNNNLQFFIKSGFGFHSNDARSVVLKQTENSLPKAFGYELGSDFKLSKRIFINASLWSLYLQSELVYIGDEATVETNNPTQRYGFDFSMRYQIAEKLFADLDVNGNHGRLVGVPAGENFIPLAPTLTSSGGLSYIQPKGINASLRYRFIDSRPANETNSVVALGYCIIDAVVEYKIPKFVFGMSIQNLLNSTWNQAQFDTESRLQNEPEPVSELHFTPGTPFFLKASVAYSF